MEITEHEIVNAITVILNRLDELENEQKRSKDFILELKDRLIDLNACVDDILDIISDSDDLLFAEKMKKYSKMKSIFLKQLSMNMFIIYKDHLGIPDILIWDIKMKIIHMK